MSGAGSLTLWLEVGDLVHCLVERRRPSGIQRVTYEICKALLQEDGGRGRVRFVRRGDGPRDMLTVDWKQLETAFRLVASRPAEAVPRDAADNEAAVMAVAPAIVPVPASATIPQLVAGGLTTQKQVVLALVEAARLMWRHAAAAMRRRARQREARRRLAPRDAALLAAQMAMLDGVSFEAAVAPGDSLVVLGSEWLVPDYVATVRWVRDGLRMRFAVLMHDLIPLRRPEWCDHGASRTFIGWHQSVLPLADQVFTVSQATARDLKAWALEAGFALADGVQPVPMGVGVGQEAEAAGAGIRSDPPLPAAGSYVLFVSTLEARKNHVLLFRVWRRLVAALPKDRVPTLVFAGRVGRLVGDLIRQLDNVAWLDGKIRLVRDPTDAELVALYRDCQFTVFPSLFEGWGLPVTESLALGRPCLASGLTSVPEAGGGLARYFDPENLDDAYRAVRAVIDDPVGLEAWRARLVREFRPVAWQQTAGVIRRRLDALEAGRGGH